MFFPSFLASTNTFVNLSNFVEKPNNIFMLILIYVNPYLCLVKKLVQLVSFLKITTFYIYFQIYHSFTFVFKFAIFPFSFIQYKITLLLYQNCLFLILVRLFCIIFLNRTWQKFHLLYLRLQFLLLYFLNLLKCLL